MAVVRLEHPQDQLADFLQDASLEVMPRTAQKIDDFSQLLPRGSRIYIAHIEGTPIDDMVATARRLARDGFEVMPHFPARIIENYAVLDDWIRRYVTEAGVHSALVLAGGVRNPAGEFEDSMQLLRTGLFEKHGIRRIHVAGHPEGNTDIDPEGGTAAVDAALEWKQAYATETGSEMAIVTQFAFAAAPVIDWADRLAGTGISLPIHVGVAGPAKLQTLIRYAVACGVGPSLNVLQKRAKDLTKLLRPIEPTDLLSKIAAHKALHPESLIAKAHVFPLGGIRASAEWLTAHTA